MNNNRQLINIEDFQLIRNPNRSTSIPIPIPKANSDIILERKMYYNKELNDSTGFYPQLIKPKKDATSQICEIYISFKLFNYKINTPGWQQYNCSVIYGFTKENGSELLESLNTEANVNAIVITNSGGRIIFPISYDTTFYIMENYSMKRSEVNADSFVRITRTGLPRAYSM